MVDLFTGDFTYNIPLFELPGPNGGYPFNLSYHAGITMDQEASWTGLGWSLNPGAITRSMRGLPDEFNGDIVTTRTAMKPSVTVGVGAGVGAEFFGADVLSVNLGLSIYNNNYKGVGYSIDGSVGYQAAIGSDYAGNVGLGFKLDSQNGIDVSPSLSLSKKIDGQEEVYGGVKIGVGYNSREGAREMSVTSVYSANTANKNSDGNREIDSKGSKAFLSGQSASLSLYNPGYTPMISNPMVNYNVSATLKVGGDWWGVFSSAYINGFYNRQELKYNNKPVDNKAYGYLHYQHASKDEEKIMLDFNREKDGAIRDEHPNLPIPSLTYDIYSVNGQGLSAMYRPFRSDLGFVHDPATESKSKGIAVGGDVGPALAKGAVNLHVNVAESYSGPWRPADNGAIADNFTFQDKKENSLYEPWYFKVHGELSASPASTSPGAQAIESDQALKVKLSGKFESTATTTLQSDKESFDAPSNSHYHTDRTPRSQLVTPVTNEELMKGSAEEAINAYKVSYFKAGDNIETATPAAYIRTQAKSDHLAGMTVSRQDGLRYVYALPAYNKVHEEVQFSAPTSANNTMTIPVNKIDEQTPSYKHAGTNEYLRKTEIPEYTHSHLLTAILGADYVDVTGDGVSEDDLGYWVKFTYQKTADAYKWRAPFAGALFSEGLKSEPRDNMGSYTYGEKEMWYLARAETKSHIAEFSTSAREDGRGAASKTQDSNNVSARMRKLDQIKLYTRAASEYPLMKVIFDYNYQLCPGVDNNATSQGGKLTLEKVHFEHGQSSRGAMNPYEFTYSDFNPGYDIGAYDRWGVYKPKSATDPLHNQEFPYVSQNPKPAAKAELDKYVGAWSLTQIKMPSSGTIMVDYQTDDYAYVQHKQATQMFEFVNPAGTPPTNLSTAPDFEHGDTNTKVRFRLEKSIAYEGSGNMPQEEQAEIVSRYLDLDNPQLYFKIMTGLRSPGENLNEFITGYVEVNPNTSLMGLEKSSSTGDYDYGYFEVNKIKERNPFMVMAWQHLRANQPDLINKTNKVREDDNSALDQIRGLGSVFQELRAAIQGYYNFCEDKNWGKKVIADKAWIRLKSPDKIKYGGGLRVKQITMKDNWAGSSEGVYGQVYDYTTEDEGTGEIISSGVAANEPVQGGDENALHYAKLFTDNIPLRTDNNLFFEFPVNEGYYPGPGVGYRKVTVRSLATAALEGITVLHADGLFPTEGKYGTSGAAVHEFYTAREFPVIAEETEKQDEPFNLSIPIPAMGSINTSTLSSSQGYSIITNDMHGKPKQMSYYRQGEDGVMEVAPYSSVAYAYAAEEKAYENTEVQVLSNAFRQDQNDPSLLTLPGTTPSGNVWYMGQETEFFLDMRKHRDQTWVAGTSIDVDVVIVPLLFIAVPIPIPTWWPSLNTTTSEVKTVVANKVIFKSGIMTTTTASNEGSEITTENLKWDKLTGQPVVTKVNNNFDEPIYSYSRAAYLEYAGMGAAYQNIGLKFTLSGISTYVAKDKLYSFSTAGSTIDNSLYPGDEWILYDATTENVLGKAVYVGKENEKQVFYSEAVLPVNAKALIVRSGKRNQLSISAGSITALEDPSVKGTAVSYDKTIVNSEN